MGLFDFLNNKEPKYVWSKFKYNPENISDEQDPSKSIITDDHKYDMTKISIHEDQTIKLVLSAAELVELMGDITDILKQRNE